MSTWIRVASAVGGSLLLAGAAWAAQTPGKKDAAAYAPCNTCHEDVVTAFLSNPHARAAKVTCESCPGDGTKHAAEGDAKLISVPIGATGLKTCLGCHGGGRDFSRAGNGAHATGSVYCADCHSIHAAATANVSLLKAQPGKECVGCHPAQANLLHKPFAHPVARGAMACFDCHNPHGGHDEASLKRTTAGELPCLSCHNDKRGPFVFQHVGSTAGDCMSCHEPHGSNNSAMLIRARVDQLCLECHTTLPTGLLGPQPPSFHDLRTVRYQNCTVCHAAIHGSNSSPMLLK